MKKSMTVSAALFILLFACSCGTRSDVPLDSPAGVAENVQTTLKIMGISATAQAGDVNGNGVEDIVVMYHKDKITDYRLAYLKGAVTGAVTGTYDELSTPHDLVYIHVVGDVYVARVSDLFACTGSDNENDCILTSWKKNPEDDSAVYGEQM